MASGQRGRSEFRRAAGTWLEGPPRRTGSYAGERLGMPESGRASVASFGEKFLALLIDLAISSVVGLLLVRPATLAEERTWNLVSVGVFVVLTSLLLMRSGKTAGQRVMSLQVVRRDGARIGPLAVVRQVLVALLVPPLFADVDRRGWHDKACNTIVVRVR